jgi:translation elongation factor EF-Tu-like GTPase
MTELTAEHESRMCGDNIAMDEKLRFVIREDGCAVGASIIDSSNR